MIKTSRGEEPLTVKALREKLAEFPDDYMIGAYEGEGVGLNVYDLRGAAVAWVDAEALDYQTTPEWEEHLSQRRRREAKK